MKKNYEVSCFCTKTNTDVVVEVISVSMKNVIKQLNRKVFPTVYSVYCLEEDKVYKF